MSKENVFERLNDKEIFNPYQHLAMKRDSLKEILYQDLTFDGKKAFIVDKEGELRDCFVPQFTLPAVFYRKWFWSAFPYGACDVEVSELPSPKGQKIRVKTVLYSGNKCDENLISSGFGYAFENAKSFAPDESLAGLPEYMSLSGYELAAAISFKNAMTNAGAIIDFSVEELQKEDKLDVYTMGKMGEISSFIPIDQKFVTLSETSNANDCSPTLSDEFREPLPFTENYSTSKAQEADPILLHCNGKTVSEIPSETIFSEDVESPVSVDTRSEIQNESTNEIETILETAFYPTEDGKENLASLCGKKFKEIPLKHLKYVASCTNGWVSDEIREMASKILENH